MTPVHITKRALAEIRGGTGPVTAACGAGDGVLQHPGFTRRWVTCPACLALLDALLEMAS